MGPLALVNRQKRLKTLPSRNFVGERKKSIRIFHAFHCAILVNRFEAEPEEKDYFEIF